jgi:Cu(I)/Ag(I) efflux system membrane protein CusA/SilA
MVARIVEACARHRGFVLLLVGFVTIVGLWSLRQAKLDAIPDLSEPQVIVFAEWMGRSPTLVEDQVTYPLVSALVSAPKVKDVRGLTMFGMAFVYVVFEDGTDLYWARSRVNEYLGGIRSRLPAGVNPVLGPDATGIGWAYQYALVDKKGAHRLEDLRAYQDTTLRFALGAVPGVAEVATVGGFQKEYQVQVDPQRLQALGLTVPEVVAAVRASSEDVGGRVLELDGREAYVRGLGFVKDPMMLDKAVVRARGPGGAPVLLRDVATVAEGPALRRGALDWNGMGETVGGIVVVRQGENALEVIERVKRKLLELKPSLPSGVEVEVAYDRTDLIHRAITTLLHALLEEAGTVAVVIFLFLLHFRSALLPILTLPVAVVLAFIPMHLLDIPSTIMSLGGIAIALGATVDAEIVMVEAAHKKLEQPHEEKDRARLLAEAAREVTPAIFGSLLLIAVAFLPVFTLTGQAGRLFRPLAFTKTFVMLASALLSITFAPALRDLLLRGRIRPEREHPVSRALIAVYKPFVYVALRKPRSTVAIGVLALISAVPLAMKLGHEFMPPLDEGDALYMPITMPNVSIEEAKRSLQKQDQRLREVPEVASVFGKVGRAETPTDSAPLTMVETTVRLKPREQWRKVHNPRWYSTWAPDWLASGLRLVWPDVGPMTWEQLTADLNTRLLMPGWTGAWTMPIKTRIDMLSTGIRTPVGIKVQGNDLAAIEQVGTRLEQILRDIHGTRSVVYERSLGGMYVDVVPDRDQLARYGLTVADVERLVETAIGGQVVAETIQGRNRYGISVRLPQDLRADVERLRQIPVPLPSAGGTASPPAAGAQVPAAMGEMAPGLQGQQTPAVTRMAFVPLGQVAEVKMSSGPPMIRDEGGLLTGYLYVDIDPAERDLGGYVDEARQVVNTAIAGKKLVLPVGTSLHWTGQYEQLAETNERMKAVIPLTLLLVIFILWLQFRDFTQVLIVLLSIPFALVGSVWLMWLLDYRVSTAVWVGVLALVGLAAQTGVVMILYIDHAYEKRKAAGKMRDLHDIIWAHMEGTVMRVRPKLMTVGTMLMGLVPLLWATGSGADVMKRVAVPMIGGLLTSAFLTLEIIPVLYTYWRQEQVLWERLEALDLRRLGQLRAWRTVQAVGWTLVAAVPVALAYVTLSRALVVAGLVVGGVLAIGGALAYRLVRPAARRLVWPTVRTSAGPAVQP